MTFLDKYGYPVELIIGMPFTNFVRILLHANVRRSLHYPIYRFVMKLTQPRSKKP